jgi:pyrroloquinoline quinone biosynthesis protein B
MKAFYFCILSLLFLACTPGEVPVNGVPVKKTLPPTATSIVVLGTIQDGGSPHIGCTKDCCRDLFEHPDETRQVVALGLYDAPNNKRYLFEATPDVSRQLKALKNYGAATDQEMPDGIFLTHAHMGHYTGLMYLGKEAKGASDVSVFAMPKMKVFLESNGPWSQLVSERNIRLRPLENKQAHSLSDQIMVTPLLVPHRDEFSETVGYRISGPNKKALFIPDIDKWEKWDEDILEEIKSVDYAFVDATFYSGVEIGNRDIALIPHPFIIESMEIFSALSEMEKQKVVFIHFNHTNPVIDSSSAAAKTVLKHGYRIAEIGEAFEL